MIQLRQILDTPEFQQFMTEIASKCSNVEYAKNIGIFIVQGWKNGLINTQNWKSIIEKINSVSSFDNLPVQDRGVFGTTFHDNSANHGLHVRVNPDLDEFHRRQYCFHELTHVILDGESEKVKGTVEKEAGLNINNNGDRKILNDIENGYIVIEESIAQEVSEMLVYSSYGVNRPSPGLQKDNAIGRIKFRSNWHYYGLYHPIGIAFAKTFRGIGCLPETSDRNDCAMKLLCKKAFDGEFSKQICEEYDKDGYFLKLCQIFRNLAVVCGVKQASFGVGNIPYTQQSINMSERAYSQVFDELTELEERRPPLSRQRNDIEMDR